MARRRFYIIREGRKRQEFKTWQEARTAYQGQQAPVRKMVAVEDTQPLSAACQTLEADILDPGSISKLTGRLKRKVVLG